MRPSGKAAARASAIAPGEVWGGLVEGVEGASYVVGQEPAQALVEVGQAGAVAGAGGAEIDDAVHRQRAAVVGQPAAFEGAQEPADQRRLADAAAANDAHHAQGVVGQEIGDLAGLGLAVLEPPGGDQGRWVDELSGAGAVGRRGGAAFVLEAGVDAALYALAGAFRVGDDGLLTGDLAAQLGDVGVHQGAALGGHAGALALGVFGAVLECAQVAFGRVHPGEVLAQPRQGRVEVAAEVDVFAGVEAQRDGGVGVQAQRDDRLLVTEGADPFVLADGAGAHAVGGDDEEQAFAAHDGLVELVVPVAVGGVEAALVEPDRDRRRAGFEFGGELEGEGLAVGGRVTDEKVGHAMPPVMRHDDRRIGRPAPWAHAQGLSALKLWR